MGCCNRVSVEKIARCVCRDKGQTQLGKCVCCFQARSVNPLIYSGLLQTSESAGSFLSCSVALTMLLMPEGPDGNRCCPALSCASTWSGGGQRLGGSQSFSLQCRLEGTGGRRGGSLPLFGSGGLLSAPCASKEMVFQVICWDFTGISSLTSFLPWAWMPAGSPLTSSCGMSKQFSSWGIKQLSPAGCWIRHRGSWMDREVHPQEA